MKANIKKSHKKYLGDDDERVAKVLAFAFSLFEVVKRAVSGEDDNKRNCKEGCSLI